MIETLTAHRYTDVDADDYLKGNMEVLEAALTELRHSTDGQITNSEGRLACVKTEDFYTDPFDFIDFESVHLLSLHRSVWDNRKDIAAQEAASFYEEVSDYTDRPTEALVTHLRRSGATAIHGVHVYEHGLVSVRLSSLNMAEPEYVEDDYDSYGGLVWTYEPENGSALCRDLVHILNEYLTGNVFRVNLYEATVTVIQPTPMVTWKHVDEVWGVLGDNADQWRISDF